MCYENVITFYPIHGGDGPGLASGISARKQERESESKNDEKVDSPLASRE